MSVSVLIVDDEELSRYALRTMILKYVTELGVVLEADSGPFAVQLALEKKIDIILMDIRIPGLDGLEAARRILVQSPETIIFIISAHDNFEYAQKALEIGVKGYILKPFRAEDIAPRIQAAVVKITCRNTTIDHAPVLRKAMEGGLIQSYIARNRESILVYKAALGDIFSAAFFVLIENFSDISFNLIADFFPALFRDALFQDGDILVLLVPVKRNHPLPEKESIRIASLELYNRLKKGCPASLRLGVGPIGTDDEGIMESFTGAVEALSRTGPEGGVIHGDDRSEVSIGSTLNLAVLEDAFFQEIRTGRIAAAREVAIQSLEHSFRTTTILKESIDFAIEFLLVTKIFFFKLGFKNTTINFRTIFVEFSSLTTPQELISRFNLHLSTLLAAFEEKPSGAIDNRRIGIINYINTNLFNPELSLDTAADQAGCSPQYFCRLFRAIYERTFTDYVTSKRLELAKHSLATSNLSVSDIARKAGFSDINYFCRVFKKGTGFRPNEYRTYAHQAKTES